MKIYTIYGRYNGQVETIDTADTKSEAMYMVGEYRMAYGADWVIWYH